MTISSFSQARGAKRWAKRTGGLEEKINELITQVNSLVLSGITADTFFAANTQTIAIDTTLTVLTNVQYITASNAALSLTLPSASGAATVFDGGVYWIINAGSTNKFTVKDNAGGTLLDILEPGEMAAFICLTDSTAAGTWRVQPVYEPDDSAVYLYNRAVNR